MTLERETIIIGPPRIDGLNLGSSDRALSQWLEMHQDRGPSWGEQITQAEIRLAEVRFLSENSTSAREIIGTILDRDEVNPRALTLLGEISVRDGNFEEAERLFDRALSVPGIDYEPLSWFVSKTDAEIDHEIVELNNVPNEERDAVYVQDINFFEDVRKYRKYKEDKASSATVVLEPVTTTLPKIASPAVPDLDIPIPDGRVVAERTLQTALTMRTRLGRPFLTRDELNAIRNGDSTADIMANVGVDIYSRPISFPFPGAQMSTTRDPVPVSRRTIAQLHENGIDVPLPLNGHYQSVYSPKSKLYRLLEHDGAGNFIVVPLDGRLREGDREIIKPDEFMTWKVETQDYDPNPSNIRPAIITTHDDATSQFELKSGETRFSSSFIDDLHARLNDQPRGAPPGGVKTYKIKGRPGKWWSIGNPKILKNSGRLRTLKNYEDAEGIHWDKKYSDYDVIQDTATNQWVDQISGGVWDETAGVWRFKNLIYDFTHRTWYNPENPPIYMRSVKRRRTAPPRVRT